MTDNPKEPDYSLSRICGSMLALITADFGVFIGIGGATIAGFTALQIMPHSWMNHLTAGGIFLGVAFVCDRRSRR